MIGRIFWKIGKRTRIRKGMYVTRLGNLIIGNHYFINRGNIFDNVSLIEIGNNCTIGFGGRS